MNVEFWLAKGLGYVRFFVGGASFQKTVNQDTKGAWGCWNSIDFYSFSVK